MSMDKIVFNRFKEICPDEDMTEKSLNDLINDTNVAFKIIGYNPVNLDESVKKTYLNNDFENLYEFIFEVWRMDK